MGYAVIFSLLLHGFYHGVTDFHRQESGSLRMAKAAVSKVRLGGVSFSMGGLSAARENFLMSLTRQCLLFALILIAALLSAMLRLVQLVPVPRRPKRQEGIAK
jgi:hypothetical protein